MVTAYAASIVILSLGFVILTITLAVLCFQQPEKANAFILLLGGPLMGIIFAHAGELKRLMRNGTAKHSDND
jgi:hypothetical protein